MVSPSFKWLRGCSTRVEYLKSACASHFCWYQVVFVHCILCHFKIFLAQIFYQEVHISRARNFPRAYTTREKYFFLESAWMCNCCVYIVGVFHCLVLSLAMWHRCVFSQQMHGLALFQMTSRVFHTCRISEECVRVTFLLISSSLFPLHLVHFKIFLVQIFYQEVHILRARNFPRAYTTREKYFFYESAWMCNYRVYIVGVFHCLVLRLAMWHSCVFSQQMHGLALFEMRSRVFHACWIPEDCVRVIFLLISISLRPLHPVHCKIFLRKIFYQEVHISRAQNFPGAYNTREKYFFLESASMCNCCVYIVGVFHCLVLRLAMWHSFVFSQQMHGLALFEMSSRVFHARRIPEECVHVTFLLISSSLRPLNPVHF